MDRTRRGKPGGRAATGTVQRSPLDSGKRSLTQSLEHRPSRSAAAPTASVQRRARAESLSRQEPPPSVAGGFGEAFDEGRRVGAAREDGDVHAIAEHGLTEPAAPLPHLARIQASFGRHDVSHVQAHVGGAASDASAAMGAAAYATGNHVAFADSPDLHTAAHEAAHTVQQRGGVQLRGGVGAEGDDYERHADAVADRVVRGESAEALLDGAAAGGSAGPAVQRKERGPDAPDDTGGDEPELVKQDGAAWPVFARTGKPYIIEDRGGKPGFWVARDWITAAGDLARETDPRTKRTAYAAPSRARELLGAMGWVAAERIEFAATQLTFEFHGALSHFVVGAEAAFATGLPQGRQAVVDRDGSGGLLVTLALDDEDIAPGSPHQATTSEVTRAFRAAAAYTGIDVDPEGQTFLTAGWVPPVGMAGNGVLALTLNRTVCRTLFGMEAFDAWAGEKKTRAEEPKAPKLKLENFFKRPVPGRLTHYGDLVESNESLRLEVLVDWPSNAPDPEMFDAPPMVTPSKFGNVALMSCTWRFERIDGKAEAAPVETQATTVAEATHRFRLAAGEATGTFRVTCDARFDEYFAPATFTRDVVVMSSAATMHKLKSEAFAGLGAPDIDRQKESWTGDVRPGFNGSPLAGAGGYVEDPMARDRDRQRERLQGVADHLRGSPASDTAVTALDQEIARQTGTEHLLAGDRAKGWQTFQVRGTYLSRTEGLASGPLDLHGTVHIERHVDSYPGDGPSTTMRVRNDRTVVRIRDLSRRFEQSDFVFEGAGSTFDEALRHAFDDLAVAYPKGMVSIEAEQIKDGALTSPEGVAGPDTANGPGTGRVVGFQRSTETTWKKVKEVVWDPVASIAVNLGAIALMTLVPGSAVIVAPALVAYNSVPSIDRVKSEADRGTLTLGTFAMSTGEVALNLLPLVSRARPFTAGWYMVETANWGGQVALMSVSAIGTAQQLQATQVAALAQEYEQFLELQNTSLPSDPGLASAEEAIRHKAAALDGEISRQFWALVEDNVFQMAAGSVIHNTATHARAAIVERLGKPTGTTVTSDGVTSTTVASEAPAGETTPRSDTAHEAVNGRARAPDDTGPPPESDSGTHRSDRTPGVYDDASEASTRKPFSPEGVAENRKILQDGDPGLNAIVGHVGSEQTGRDILQRLSHGDRAALAELGVSHSEGFNPSSREWGLGRRWDGKLVVIAGEPGAVDWSVVHGVTPLGHSHPRDAGRRFYQGGRKLDVERLVSSDLDGQPGTDAALVFPSPQDIEFMVQRGLRDHFVAVPYEQVGVGEIAFVKGIGASSKGVTFELSGGERILGDGSPPPIAYTVKARMVAGGTPLWSGELTAIFEPNAKPRLSFERMPKGSAAAKSPTGSVPDRVSSGGAYDPTGRSLGELQADRLPQPQPGESPADAAARVRAAEGELIGRAPAVADALGDAPRRIDLRAEDPSFDPEGAHTIENHGADIPLRVADNPGGKSIEGRIDGLPPWASKANSSYKWLSDQAMNQVVNDYLQAHWEEIRIDLALSGRHAKAFDAQRKIGEGFFNEGMYGTGPRRAKYSTTSLVRILVVLDGGSPPRYFVYTTFPNALGGEAY
jgi:hypothetical protein